jgi:hypothetical protein
VATRLTPDELARRETLVREALTRSPWLTKSHFQHAYDYQRKFLNTLEAKGIVFGTRKTNPFGRFQGLGKGV